MGKNSKLRRDLKKVKIKTTPKKLKEKNTPNSLSEPVVTMMNNPFKDFTDEQRKELILEVSQKSKKSLTEILEFLDNTFRNYDPLILISIFSSYHLTVGIGNNGVNTKESPNTLNQSHVELVQALILQIPENELGQLPPTPDIVQETKDKLITLGEAFKFSRMNEEQLNASKTDIAINKIQEWFRLHTQMVRNWGFHSQILNISKEIYSHFDQSIIKELGFSASNVIDIFEIMLTLTEERVSQRMRVLTEIK